MVPNGLASRVAKARSGRFANDQLTVREREVLGWVASGYTNQEIASALTVSVQTVKTHIVHMLEKLDARSRAQAVAIGYETGLL